MNRGPGLAILLLVFAASLTAFPIPTPAQCFSALPGLGPIDSLTGNPFQAEVKQTFLHDNPSAVQSFESGARRVIRDNQGRVRVEFSAGKYKIKNGPDAGNEEEQRNITICDPVTGESISLDTLNKIATVQKVRLLGTPSAGLPAPLSQPSFCSRQFRGSANISATEVSDLGHRTIEGMDAQGVQQRRVIQLQGARNGDAALPPRELISMTETWCSAELGAIILRVIGTEKNSNTQTIAMVNIQRGEPEATLFQIPPGYRIVERVYDPALRTGAGVIGSYGVLSSAEPTLPPSKP